MKLGTSLLLIATGAILRFAVDPRPHIAGTFVNWNIVGDIFIATGIVGIIASLLLARSAGRQTTTTIAPPTPEA